MKTQILLGVGLCLLTSSIKAQSKLIFNYDFAGNQIRYRYCEGSDCNAERSSETEDSIAKQSEVINDLLVDEKKKFLVYPNPTKNIVYADLNFKSDVKLVGVQVLDVSGKLMNLQFVKTSFGAELSLERFVQGLYFIQFSFSDNTRITQKILKN